MHNLQDEANLNPEYRFILENLEILTTDIDWTNIRSKFPARKEFSIMQNQNLINLKRQIVRDISEGKDNEFVYLNAYQWETIVNHIKTFKEKELQSAL